MATCAHVMSTFTALNYYHMTDPKAPEPQREKEKKYGHRYIRIEVFIPDVMYFTCQNVNISPAK